MKVKMELIPLTGVRPLKLLILSNRADPPALIFASRRSRRRRAACCAGDSSVDDMNAGFRIIWTVDRGRGERGITGV